MSTSPTEETTMENFSVAEIHPKLRNYKFNKAEECYDFMLKHHAPKESTVISKPLSKTSLGTLKCVAILFKWEKKQCPSGQDPETSLTFAKLLGRLLYGVQAGRNYEKKARKYLSTILNQLSFKGNLALASRLFDVDKNLVCLANLYSLLRTSKASDPTTGDIFSEELGGKNSQAVLDLFVKEFLMTKVPKSTWVLENVSRNLLPCLRSPTCEETVLSAISKSLLRSPETSIEAVGHSLQGLKPNIQKGAVGELAKKIGSCLNTENETIKQHANFASRALFSGITDDNARKVALNEYFELISPTAKGTKSALTSAAKVTVLNVIKLLGKDLIQSGSQLSPFVIEKCMRILETDVHEGTLLECMEVIGAWGKGLPDQCPPPLSKYIKNGLTSLKGSIRLGLCRMMVELYADKRIKWLTEIVDPITKCVEKALAQPAVVNNLTEAVSLSLVYLNASSSFNSKENSITIPESAYALAVKVAGFVDDKFLSSCSQWALLHVGQLVHQFLNSNIPTSININARLYSLIIHCLPFADYKVRGQLKETLLRMVMDTTQKRSHEIIKQFTTVSEEVLGKETLSDHIKYEIVIGLSSCMKAIVEKNDSVKDELALSLLMPSHLFSNKDLWYNCVQKNWGLEAKHLLETKQDYIYATYVKSFDSSQTKRRILRTLTKVHSSLMLSEAVDTAVNLLTDPGFLKVSRDDYFIFLTPEGQLFNSSILENGAGDQSRNMKRESKAYSYREQLEEIQLRKELDEKKRKSGKGPTYTPKQIEAMKIQLAKEATIRNQIAELNSKVSSAVEILEELMAGDFENFGLYIKDFINELVAVMKSPVAAPPAVAFFIKLGRSLFTSKQWFGEALAQCCLRLINPRLT